MALNQDPFEQGAESRSAPRCPDCGGKMSVRYSKLGRFYGCSNYAKCTGVRECTADKTTTYPPPNPSKQ